MADPAALKPTGRRVRGYISDLVELSGSRSLWTGIVYHEDYRDDAALEPAIARARAFVELPMVKGLAGLQAHGPGVYLYDTGEVRCVRELMGAAKKGVGWRAAVELVAEVARILAEANGSDGSLPCHGNLDPHRILVDYDGAVQIVGYGLPRLDLLDFIDDASLVPHAEALRFTAPESLEGAVEDFSTDLFVLMLVAAELATGQPVFPGANAKEVLAVSGDGEGRRALRALDLPDGLDDALGAMLEPWPEDRPKSAAAVEKAARALLKTLDGDDLAAVMDGLAETASDVEVDLPKSWTLPLATAASAPEKAPVPVEPEPAVLEPEPEPEPAEDPAAIAGAAREADGHAKAAEKASADLAKPVGAAAARDWSIDDDARALFDEVGTHAKAAERAASEAREAAGAAGAATDLATAREQAGIASDAAERAQGAAAEGKRTLDRAAKALDAAEERRREEAARQEEEAAQAAAEAKHHEALANRVAALGKTLEVVDGLVAEAAALRKGLGKRDEGVGDAFDAVIEALDACRDAGTDAKAASRPELTDEGVAAAEKAVRAAHKAAAKALDAAKKAEVALGEARSAQAAANAELAKGQAELDALAKEARSLAGGAGDAIDAFAPAHPDARAVSMAVEEARHAASDASSCAEEVERIELEPQDDPVVVLDAARTHLEATRSAAERSAEALERARAADEAETEALAAAERARQEAAEKHRADLTRAGERLEAARKAATDARKAADKAVKGVSDDAGVTAALEALHALCDRVDGRKSNYDEVAASAAGVADADALEDLLHTALAEADFADGDVAELPELSAAVTAAAEAAREAMAAAEAAKKAALERTAAAEKRARAAEQAVAKLSGSDPMGGEKRDAVRNDEEVVALSRDFTAAVAATGMALHTVNEALATLRGSDEAPEALLEQLEEAADEAHAATEEAARLHAELTERVAARVAEIEAAAKARQKAIDTAQKALAGIGEALASAAVAVPDIADEAVAERVAAEVAALKAALEGVPAAPEVDIEADPDAAVEQLSALLPTAKDAAKAVTQATKALDKALEKATTLVEALRAANARAEAAADRAATASAAARELIRGLEGEWPGVEEAQEALREMIHVADQAAAQATAESEAVAEATTAKDAEKRANAAEQAAAIADEALAEAKPRAEELAKLVEAARARIAEEERAAQVAAIEAARTLGAELPNRRAAIEEAVERAGNALADSPSAAGRAAWSEADGVVDDAMAALARAESALEAAENATDSKAAEKHRKKLESELAAIGPMVERATELANAAIEAARADAEANAGTVSAIEAAVAEILGFGSELAERVESARQVAEATGDAALADLLASLEEQAGHVRQAGIEANDALEAAPTAADEPARKVLKEAAVAAAKRARAANNTAAALQKRLDAARAAHAEALEKRRADAVKQIGKLREGAAKRHTQLVERADAAAAAQEGWPEVDAALEGLAKARQAAAEALAAVDAAVAAGEGAEDAVAAESAREAVTAAVAAFDTAIAGVNTALEAVQSARDAAEASRAAAIEAARAAHAAALEEADGHVKRAVETATAARERLEKARTLLEATPARSAATAWKDASAAVEAAEAARARAEQTRADLPSEPPDPDAMEALSGAVASIRAAADEARDTAATVEPTLAGALQSATALAGILDDAVAVRKRFVDLEEQLTSRRAALADALIGAERDTTLRAAADAERQFEELDQTLGEARTSLEELGEASGADEAEALLEVARASLDIAGSVFEFAIPLVDTALAVAEEEASERRAVREAVEAARTAIAAAADIPAADEHADSVAALRTAGAAVEADDDVATAWQMLQAARSVLGERRAHLVGLATAAVPETVDGAGAAAQAATKAREAFDAARSEVETLVGAVRESIEAATAAESERKARIASALEALAAINEALAQQKQAAAEAREAAASASEGWEDATREPLRALEAALARLDAAAPSEPADPDDEASVAQATLEAESVRDDLAGIDLSALVSAVVGAAEAARSAAEEAEAALQAARDEHAELVPRWKARTDAAAQSRAQADQIAVDYPLEAGEALTALDEAIGAWPGVHLELPEDPAEAAEAVAELRGAVALAEKTDLDALVAGVRAAVEAARAEEEARAKALKDAGGALQETKDRLVKRQEAARAVLDDLADAAAWPEAESAYNELADAVAQLTALAIDTSVPPDPQQARLRVEAALETAKRDFAVEALAEAVRTAVSDAEGSREAARARVSGAHEMLEAQRGVVRKAVEREGLPDDPPVTAAMNELRHALERLDAITLPVAPEQPTPTRALLALADEAEAKLARALEMDVKGLLDELHKAVEIGRARALAEQEARDLAARQALDATQAAVRELQASIDAAESLLRGAPAVPEDRAVARGHRSAARDALESARAGLSEVRDAEHALTGDLPAERAIEIVFEAETAADAARESLAGLRRSLESLEEELQRMDAAIAALPERMEAIAERAESVAATAADAPDPAGDEAVAAHEKVIEAYRQSEEKRALASRLADEIAAASSAAEAEGVLARIGSLEDEIADLAESARAAARTVRELSEAELERQAAARAEAVAAHKERARLAADRAASALERVGNVLATASDEARGSTDDPEIGAELTRIAEANDTALQASDAAKEAAAEAQEGDGAEAAGRAVELADSADAALAEANGALDAIRARRKALQEALDAATAERESEQLAKRDTALVKLRADTSSLESELERLRALAEGEDRDEAVVLARDKLLAAADGLADQVAGAQANLELLENGRWDEVDDFMKDARAAIATSMTGLTALRAAATVLQNEREAATKRRRELEIEEHRGRAWEACKVGQQLAARMAAARSALPEIPDDPNPELRAALDRLAEVERRLWRAGQRADEARERAGGTHDLEEAREAADIAEKAIGAAGRWEKEIDAALEEVTAVVKGLSGIVENPRMARLRRGRLGPKGEEEVREIVQETRQPEGPPEDEPTSATEALLQRLRRGRQSGETGRERLKRLREQRKEEEEREQKRQQDARRNSSVSPLEPVALAPRTPPEDAATNVANEYGGLEDFEDLKPTTIAKPEMPVEEPSAADRRRALMDRLRRRTGRSDEDEPEKSDDLPGRPPTPPPPRHRELPEDEGRTQMFTRMPAKDDMEDAKTQMFTRDMIEDIAGELDDDEDDED